MSVIGEWRDLQSDTTADLHFDLHPDLDFDHGLDAGSAPGRSRRPLLILAGVVLTVTLLDQVSKWWAYRHTAWPLVNVGGNLLIGTTLSRWLSYSSLGAVLDLVGALMIAVGAYLLLRRPRRTATTVAGALFLAGWSSNLLDRLRLHEWTAPGSARGVVDFIFIGTQTFNFADISIAAGTAGLVLTATVKLARVALTPVRDLVPPDAPARELTGSTR